MTASPINIEELERETGGGSVERLRFGPGLNILVGRPNTGKTVWLTMLDYALGDRSPIEHALSAELADKYSIIRAVLRIGGDVQIVIERRWKEAGSKHKVYVDGRPLSVEDFSSYFLSELGIPVLHYPQGDPYSSRAWPELSWRSLFRHMYRRQDIGWGGIVERQPPGEQHACLLQFLGIAEFIYSDDYESLVSLRKARTGLEARRENYLTTLNEISRDLLEVDSVTGITPDGIADALREIEDEIQSLRERKNATSDIVLNQRGAESASILRERAKDRAEIIALQSGLFQELREGEHRLQLIHDYLAKVDDERTRLERAQVSGRLFADLRITNCPACDQPIRGTNDGVQDCFLCKRVLPMSSENSTMAQERVAVGLMQLQEEARESKQLENDLEGRIRNLRHELRVTQEKQYDIESDIERARQPASTVFSEEVSQIDVEIGRLEERRKQWIRIAGAFEEREVISKNIVDLESKIADLDAKVNERNVAVDFTRTSDALVDGMNDYMRLLNTFRSDAWSQSEVALSLRERQFRFTVGGEPWASRLGGTLTLYFLLAYQFGLLKLSSTAPYNYPGITVLDMPAELPDIELRILRISLSNHSRSSWSRTI